MGRLLRFIREHCWIPAMLAAFTFPAWGTLLVLWWLGWPK